MSLKLHCQGKRQTHSLEDESCLPTLLCGRHELTLKALLTECIEAQD